jgi:hypothetical protein
MYRKLRLTVLALCAVGVLCAQDDPPPQAPAGWWRRTRRSGRRCGGSCRPAALRSRDHQGSQDSKGLFTVHQIKERYYYEIPKHELGKDLLWNSQIAKTTRAPGTAAASSRNHVSAGS